MSIYSIDYKSVVDNILPPQYRVDKMKNWLYSLVQPIQWLRDKFFDNYVLSPTYIYTDFITNTVVADAFTLIRFPDNSVWETQIDNVDVTIYNPLIGELTMLDGTLVWIKVLSDFIGLNERAEFNNQKLEFEYLLNRYFNHLTSTTHMVNDIYIGTNDTAHNMMMIAELDEDSMQISETDDGSLFWISEGDNENQNYNFTIYIPTFIATEMGVDYETKIRAIADKYNFLSLYYNVTLY